MPEFFRDNWPANVRRIEEVYSDDQVPDAVWMQRCDAEGWVVVCKDGKIRSRDGERHLLSRGTLRVFCLPNGQMKRDDMVARFAQHLEAMKEQSLNQGPWLFSVYAEGIKEMTLYT